jgi:hypothetical protein
MKPEPCIAPPSSDVRITPARRVALWLMSGALAALGAYFGVLSYLSPDLLLNFSSSLIC